MVLEERVREKRCVDGKKKKKIPEQKKRKKQVLVLL